MSSKFLDKTGLDTLWAKIKSTFQTLGNLVTAWGSTPSDTKYPSEKLVKNSLDGKVSVSDVKNASWGVNILRQSFQAKNGTTVDNTNKTITATYDTSKSTDIYCYATTSVPIVLGETYTISFDVIESNLTEGQYWEWGFFGQGHAVFRITGTGHYSKTLVSDINRSVGYSALIDDSGKSLSNGSYIVMKNIKYEIGPFETKYSDLDSLLVTGSNALSTTLGPMIRALDSWSNPAEGEFIPAASGSSQGRYTLRKIFDFFKSLMVSDSGVNISGNAGTATTAAGYTSGGAIDTALQGKATPADITSAIQALDVDSQGGDGKYIKAISEADGKISATAETMDTAPTANSTKAVTSGGVKTALDGKQDALGISSSGDAGKFLNMQGSWQVPPKGDEVLSIVDNGTTAYGFKIATTSTDSATNYPTVSVTAIVSIRQWTSNTSMGSPWSFEGFLELFHRRQGSGGTEVYFGRLYTITSFDGSVNKGWRVYAVRNGTETIDWYIAPHEQSQDTSFQYMSLSFFTLSKYTNGATCNIALSLRTTELSTFLTRWVSLKMAYLPSTDSNVGSATNPVYVGSDGQLTACKKLVQAVTSINTSNMDPDVLYVM